jgi:site-specific DNA-cytosine methylase
MQSDFYVADLFAGAGGLTQGFRQADFSPVVAVEFDKWAAQTYAANFGDHVLACAIEDVQVRGVGDGLRWAGCQTGQRGTPAIAYGDTMRAFWKQ